MGRNPPDRQRIDMIDLFSSIKRIMADMQSHTSANDPRYEAMRDVIEMCDEGMSHFIDDGK